MAQTTPRTPREQYRAPRKEPPAQPPRRRSRKPVRRSPAGRIVLLILLAVVGLFSGWLYRHRDMKFLPGVFAVTKTPQDVFPGKPFINLVIIGHDYDYTNKDQVIRNARGRSDLLMVAHIDFVNKTAHLLSIPRDTRADIPGHGVHKINAAHEFGGAPLVEQTLLANYGIPSDNYMTIDFDGFEQAIDQLGGVDLQVDRKMDYDDNWGHLHIHLKPGMQHLDGRNAMGFVRFRHADSDFVRVRRQQTLLAALKEKLRNPLMLAKIPDVLDTIDRHVDSDLTEDQKVVLAHYLHDLPKDKIAMDTLPSLDSSGTLVSTDWPKARPMIQRIFGVTVPDTAGTDAPRSLRRRHHRRVAAAG